VALKQLMDLEKEVITFAATSGLSGFFPQVGSEQLHGIEVNSYAHELAQVVVWIGYIQWLHDNGFGIPSSPILKPLHNIQRMDAILAYDDEGRLVEPEWPEADVIVGNPPFLGSGKLRQELGVQYTGDLYSLYADRLPASSDLVCYWFEKSRALVADGKAKRARLLATQGIRGRANRRVLDRIKERGNIFWAYSDRDWVLDGATVHVSMIGFDDGREATCMLDGRTVPTIHADLTSSLHLTIAKELRENSGIAFKGPSPAAPFDIDSQTAQKMLDAPANTNGRRNSDVVRPLVSAIDIAQRSRQR
jgi:hypothetical protein